MAWNWWPDNWLLLVQGFLLGLLLPLSLISLLSLVGLILKCTVYKRRPSAQLPLQLSKGKVKDVRRSFLYRLLFSISNNVLLVFLFGSLLSMTTILNFLVVTGFFGWPGQRKFTTIQSDLWMAARRQLTWFHNGWSHIVGWYIALDDPEVEGFNVAAARIREKSSILAVSESGDIVPEKKDLNQTFVNATKPKLELRTSMHWEKKAGLQVPVFDELVDHQPMTREEYITLGKNSPHEIPPCNNQPIKEGVCLYGNDVYACYQFPGKQVITDVDSAPSPDCLGGRESWSACSDGKFLCKPSLAQEPTVFHTIFNVQSSRYFEWQVRYLNYCYKKSGQDGPVTRLLSASNRDHLFQEVNSWLAPPYPKLSSDPYLPYNKPTAVHHWLSYSGVRAEYIIVVDPDCLFLRPLAEVQRGKIVVNLGNGKQEVVEKGKPFGQKGYMDYVPGGPFQTLSEKYCKDCKFVDPLAVPLVIHREDLKKIAPLWLTITEEIRSDKPNWLPAWTASNFALSWTAEMYGYIFAAARLGIKHTVSDRAQEIVGFNKRVAAPILHYSLKIDVGDGKSWHKYYENAGSVIPDPSPKIDDVKKRLLQELKEARDKLGSTNKVWGTASYFAAEP
uniref:Hydroxyproline O-arabinosyltransferase-like domain-containing protein n=1 Tax=Guillardia theta TaxID=55529 RepID=A0A7S4P999_GUITH|mmetsp:Transcript_45754/g.143581  ORF Transcript_45754/g.143581 Transcript_45754/m.143581 type:complete len:616 (+) Transcript_45754:212-2059(+)